MSEFKRVRPPFTSNLVLDYCIVAFFIVIVISTVQWFVDGRKNFHGPKVEFVDTDVIVGANSDSDPTSIGKDGKAISELNGNMSGQGLGISELAPEHVPSELGHNPVARSELDGVGTGHHLQENYNMERERHTDRISVSNILRGGTSA